MNARRAFNIADGSFNRYMVECEYKLGAGVDAVELSFNRYMVECE